MATPITVMVQPALPRLLMADDHQLVLDALVSMMKTDFDVRAVGSFPALLDSLETFQPDVVMLDTNLSGGHGFSAAQKVREKKPNVPVVFLSMDSEPTYNSRAAQLGAKACLTKRTSAGELIDALRAVLNGESLLEETSHVAQETAPQELTSRQVEVLRLIAQGCSAKEIANRLSISVRTAEFHRAAIMQRLGIHSTAQMTRYALANNLG